MAFPIVVAAKKAYQIAKIAYKTVKNDPDKKNILIAVVAALGILIAMPVVIVYSALNAISIQANIPKGWCQPELDAHLAAELGEEWYEDGAASSGTADPGSAATATTVPAATGTVVMPVPEGRYRLASPYGMRVHPITKTAKMHEGTDFSAIPKGARDIPILAVADGIVRASGPVAGFGQYVTIEHNIGGAQYVSVYGHVQAGSQTVVTGDTVTAGQKIAIMSDEGGSTGVHLHLEIWTPTYHSGGKSLDPGPWLASAGATALTEALDGSSGLVASCGSAVSGEGGVAAGPWGGHENGKIPAEEMCAPPTFPNHLLRCDAASAVEALNVAFQAKFGRDLLISDSYRSYDAQVKCREQKGNWCATPGKSNHGWGLAIDVSGGINEFGTPEHEWMRANAAASGWVHPGWAQQGGAKPEPWHWEFAGSGGAGASGDGRMPESAKALAQTKTAAYGWGGNEFTQCLVPLWQKESGWNYQAANGSSSARGIPQAMMSAHFGSGWKSNAAAQAWLDSPDQQITWGLDYIKGRYGTPCSAWSHSQKTGWY